MTKRTLGVDEEVKNAVTELAHRRGIPIKDWVLEAAMRDMQETEGIDKPVLLKALDVLKEIISNERMFPEPSQVEKDFNEYVERRNRQARLDSRNRLRREVGLSELDSDDDSE